MAYTSESIPEDSLSTLLDDNWVEYEQIPKPQIIVANLPEEPYARFDMNLGDAIIIRSEVPEQIRYRGNITYIDRIYTLNISIWTKESRQRLRDLYRTIRAICLIKKHDFPSWQLIRLQSYQELVSVELNIWRGEIRLQLENHGILAETAV